MADYKAPLRDMCFVLSEVFEVSRLWAQLPALVEMVNAETAAATLEKASRVTAGTIAPLNRPGDEKDCQWSAGAVSTPAGFPETYRTYVEGGWVDVGGDPVYDGMGMPGVISAQVEKLINLANLSFGLYPMLIAGACLALSARANDELKDKYLLNMYAGIWAGSMCLTEPHAGTDLGIIRIRAEPRVDGSYKISGTKIFVTDGEHDLTKNIVHLVLAKLPDTPARPKGISPFLVPKVLVNADGSLGEKNSLDCGSIGHEMRIKVSAICVMNFDDATGWLMGEVNKGLAAMFIMMNYECLGVGIQGLVTGERSYQSVIEYTCKRIQDRTPIGPVAKDKAADSIIMHPDVRRMLLTMKALNEGGRAFSSYVAMQLDTAKYSEDAVTRKRAEGPMALLTPVAKASLTNMGLEITIHGQQIFGGHGFIREWGQEQLVRDCRITQVYEGTNGIQTLGLVGRKVIGSGGAFSRHLTDEIRAFVTSVDEALGEFGKPLAAAVENLEELTAWLLDRAKGNPNEIGAASVEYPRVLGYTAYAYMWVLMVRTVLAKRGEDDLYASKLGTTRFYFARLLPRTHSLSASVCAGSESLYLLDAEQL